MKRLLALSAVMAILLCGCGTEPDIRDVGEAYRQAQQVTAQAQVAVSAEGSVIVYAFDYSASAVDPATVTLTAPQGLAGVTARLPGGGQAVIEYQGASAETLLPGISGYTPVDALHGVLADLRGNLPQTQGKARWGETDCLLLTYVRQAEGLEKQVWLEAETGAVRHCEFFADGQMIMAMDVLSLSLF